MLQTRDRLRGSADHCCWCATFEQKLAALTTEGKYGVISEASCFCLPCFSVSCMPYFIFTFVGRRNSLIMYAACIPVESFLFSFSFGLLQMNCTILAVCKEEGTNCARVWSFKSFYRLCSNWLCVVTSGTR